MRNPLIFALAGLAGLTTGIDAQAPPIDLSIAQAYFDEIATLQRADPSGLWGRRVAGPMLFVDPASGFIVANRAAPDGSFQAQGRVFTGKLPEGQVPANTGIDIGGLRWAMIMWPVPDNRYTRRRLLLHESFHRVQDSLGFPGKNPANAHLNSADGRIWLRLEMRALTEALLRTGEERRRAIRDALSIRQRRHALSPTAAEEERQLELNEGLAEYTGYKLSGLPHGVLPDRVAIHLAQQETQESQSRSFAYATGPAYALLLDQAAARWRNRLDSASDLASLLRSAYRIDDVRASRADSLVDTYSAERMVRSERAREAQRIATEEKLRRRFNEEPTLTLPVVSRFNFSFDPNNVVSLAELGTYYESSRITDEWGSLVVSSGGVLLRRNATGQVTGVVVPAPVKKESGIEGEGWKLTLSPGWTATPSRVNPSSFVVARDTRP